jgi:hypothetical protein
MFHIISHYYNVQHQVEILSKRIQNISYSNLIHNYSLAIKQYSRELVELEKEYPYLVEINSKIDEIISREK